MAYHRPLATDRVRRGFATRSASRAIGCCSPSGRRVSLSRSSVGWVFFPRASLGDAWYVLTHLGAGLGGQLAALAAGEPTARRDLLFLGFEKSKLVLATAAVFALLAAERLQGSGSGRFQLARSAAPLRWAAYACAVLTIMTLGVFQSAKFIYFQF